MMRKFTAVFLIVCAVCLPSASVAVNAMPYGQEEKQYVVLAEDEQVYEKISDEIHVNTAEKVYGLEEERVVTAGLTAEEAEALSEAGDVIVEEDMIISGSTTEEMTAEEAWMRKLEAKQRKREALEDENEEEYDAECEWNLLAVNADGAAEAGETVQKVKVAVLDSGVDYVTGINLAGYVNLVEGEEELSPIFQDLTGHGTGIAGIISGNGETGIHGVNPHAEVYSVKVLDGENKAPLSRIIKGIYWCIEEEMDIINMSFGTPVYSKVLEQAVKDADAAFFDGNQVTHGTSIAVPHVTGAASLLWEKDLTKPSIFIRRLIEESAKEMEGTDACGLLDVGYALEAYDGFAERFDEEGETPETGILKNTETPESFEEVNTDEAYVEGRWGGSNHQAAVDTGSKGKGFSAAAINVIKQGAVYPDKSSWQGGNKYPWWHGRWETTDSTVTNKKMIKNGQEVKKIWNVNYVAVLEMISEVALEGGEVKKYMKYSYFNGMDPDTYAEVKNDLIVLKGKFGKVLSENTKANRKYFKRVEKSILKKRLEYLKKNFHKLGVNFRPSSLDWDEIQTFLSTTKAPLADFLLEVLDKGGNLGAYKQTLRKHEFIESDYPIIDSGTKELKEKRITEFRENSLYL